MANQTDFHDWSTPEVQAWMKTARQTLNSYYRAFNGSQWDEYCLPADTNLLLAKICYALCGPPSKEMRLDAVKRSEDLIDFYEQEQRAAAQGIVDTIRKTLKIDNNKSSSAKSTKVLFTTIFICCKQQQSQFTLPIFSVFGGVGDPTDATTSRWYIDTQRRTYKDWSDWKCNNTLPQLKYAYPRNGFFTCSGRMKYKFDSTKEVDIEFGNSPACSGGAKLLRKFDLLTAATSLGCGAIAVASFFTPIGPAVALGSAWLGGTAAVYGTGRAINRLADKSQHGERLNDLESVTLWFSIAAAPLHLGTTFMNASLIQGAIAEGRIFSSTTRMFATILNCGTLGVDAVLLGCGLANIIDKHEKDQLTTLDVVQFSMSVFFFSNTLVQPKTAYAIIESAQEAHFQQVRSQMTDPAAQATFDKFLVDNKASGGILDRSRIVRTINRMEDPNRVFTGLQGHSKVMTGGRKGRTLLVTDQNGQTNRINPNKVSFEHKTPGSIRYKPIYNQMRKHLNQDPEQIKVNGKHIFAEKNLNDIQKSRIQTVMRGLASNNNNNTNNSSGANLLTTAIEFAIKLGCQNVDQVLSIVEILVAELRKQPNLDPEVVLTNIRTNGEQFVRDIQQDLDTAARLATQNSTFHFEDPYKAVYHYRKHGADFGAHTPIEVYLRDAPAEVVKDTNLVHMETHANGIIRKFYATPADQFAVVVENSDGHRILSTLYEKRGYYAAHNQTLADMQANAQALPQCISDLPERITQVMGFRAAHIFVHLESGRVKLEDLLGDISSQRKFGHDD